MFARKCDRCGKLYENYLDPNGSAIYTFNRDELGGPLENQVSVLDLCPDCMAKFHNFMDGWEPAQFFEAEEIADTEVKTHKAGYRAITESSATG